MSDRTLFYARERHLIYIPHDGGPVQCHRYTAGDMVEVFQGWQLVELNHVGKTSDNRHDGVWIDMIWAALHYEKLAEAAALQVAA